MVFHLLCIKKKKTVCGINIKIWPKSLAQVKCILDPLIIGISLWSGCHFKAKIYGILSGMGINFQKFKQMQNFDMTTEVNLSKNAKMGKQLWMGQFWPKILFFSWAPSFGSYIDDQNLNGPLGLKRADSGCPCPYGPQQPESPCFRFLSSICDPN